MHEVYKEIWKRLLSGTLNLIQPFLTNGWKIYYSERGERTGEISYSNEEACEAFMQKVKRYSEIE